MKIKKINKLSLNKSTVANLEAGQLAAAKGGGDSDPGSTCKLCPTVHQDFCTPTVNAQCPQPGTLATCLTIDVACPTEAGYNTCDDGVVTC